MKIKAIAILNVLIILTSIFCMTSSMTLVGSNPTEWHVNPGESIQAAINHASPGDTIIVHPGTYREAININKSLDVIGSGADTTFINGSSVALSAAGLVKITATSGNVIFSGFTVSNASAVGTTRIGIFTKSNLAGPTYAISYNKIYGSNDINEWDDYGFYASGGKENVVFTHNLITQTGANNIVLELHTGSTEISHNTLDAGVWGVDAIFFMTYNGIDVTTLQNVSYNTFDMGTGVSFDYDHRATAVSFTTPGPTWGLGEAKFTNMVIAGNTINNLESYRRGIGFWNGGTGDNLKSPIITRNTINGKGMAVSWGIDFIGGPTSNALVTYNNIKQTDTGIFLRNASGAPNAKINYNNIVDNAVGINWTLGPSVVDARFNWWGSATGPTYSSNPGGTGDAISSNVDYSPWLENPFEAIPRTYHVNPTGTIQEAIDAASPGDTIIVHAGTYDEQVVINKALTLTGEGDATIIKPSGPGTFTHFYTLPTQADAGWNGKKLASIISVENVGTSGVTISELKVDGILVGGTSAPAGADWLVGILYGESAGTVENVRILNMDTPTASPPNAFNSYGIFLDAVITTVSVEVSGCTIVGYNRNGIMTRGAKLTVDINANVITGPGAIGPTSVPNGIVISYGTAGTVRYNRIFNNYYEGTTYLSFGIMGWNEKPGLIIEHNEVYDTDVGIGPTSGILIRYNDVHNCKIGIELELGAADNNIEYNQIHDNYYGIRLLGPGDPWGGYTGPGDEPGLGNTAYYNNIYGNTEGVRNWDTTQIFEAENNWWGDPTGPYHPELNPSGKGDEVSGNVDFEPWLIEPYPPAAPVEALLYVDPATLVYWTPSYGETFTINVTIANVTNLFGYEFKLYWDTALLDLINVQVTPPWPYFFAARNETNEALGRYWLSICLVGTPAFTGSAPLAKLTFRITYDPLYPETKTCKLDLADTTLTTLSSGEIELIYHMAHDGTYSIYSVEPKITVTSFPSKVRALGETVSVDVFIHDVVDLYQFNFKLGYNTTLLDVVNVDFDFLNSPFLYYYEIHEDMGYVYVWAWSYGTALPASGTGILVSITMKATMASIWPDPPLTCSLHLYETKLKTKENIELLHTTVDGVYIYQPKPGDLNADGKVDLIDLRMVAYYYDPSYNRIADLNRDKKVNIIDLSIVASHYEE